MNYFMGVDHLVLRKHKKRLQRLSEMKRLVRLCFLKNIAIR